MLDALRFVQGAVGKKDFIPALTHYRIKNGIITSYNGSIALSCPIACDLDCMPKAQPFFRAIKNCKETVSLHMTEAGRLAVQSGSFRAYIDCIPDESVTPVEPEGKFIEEFDGERIITALTECFPFVGVDASRPWSMGALIDGSSVFATNNVILVQYYTGSKFPFVCNLPRQAVAEVLRIKKIPVSVQGDATSVTFHYDDGAWLRTNLYSTEWPNMVSMILGAESNQQPIDKRLFEGIESLRSFNEGDIYNRVYLTEQGLATAKEDGVGAAYDIEGFELRGCYNISMLELLIDKIETADFTQYPAPTLFIGNDSMMRGAIVGMKET